MSTFIEETITHYLYETKTFSIEKPELIDEWLDDLDEKNLGPEVIGYQACGCELSRVIVTVRTKSCYEKLQFEMES